MNAVIMTKPQRLHRRNAQDRLVAVLAVNTARWLVAYERGGFRDPEALRLARRHHRLLVEREQRLAVR